MNGETYAIVGVMPPGAWFANTRAEVVGSILHLRQMIPATIGVIILFFLLPASHPNVSLETARSQMKSIARQLELTYPENHRTQR